jgi:small-conductance mechanosensitive channel
MSIRAKCKEIAPGVALAVCLLTLCPRTVVRAQSAQHVVVAPVTVEDKVIFSVPGIMSFPAKTRADEISKRIKNVSRDVTLDQRSVSVVDSGATTEIMVGDLVLMTVTDQDAQVGGKPRHDLAVKYAGRISSCLAALRKEYSARSLALGALYTVIATGILILIFSILGFLFPKLYLKLDAWRGTYIPSLRIQKFELMPAERIAAFAVGIAKLIRFAITLIILYFYASLVLGFFPWTRNYARILITYVIAPLNVIGNMVLAYLPNLFFIGVIIVVAIYFTKFTRVIFSEVGKKTITFQNFHPEWAQPTFKIARFIILAVTAIAIFPYLPGSQSPAFKGISIFLGVLFSLGSTSAVANIVAGVILTYMGAFKVGDRVQIADTVGDVIEASLLVTRIRTVKNVEITIANSMVLNSHIINFSGSIHPDGLILHTTVTIGYDAPWRVVHELLIGAALATENILKEPHPFVLQTALDDFYVHYQINAYTDKPSSMSKTYSDLHENIQDRFYEAGVEIMSPHYSSIRDGNRIAIPNDSLPRGYRAPSFRVGIERDPGGPGAVSK